MSSFSGAKVALFIGAKLLVIRRDSRSDIPYPNHWDLPGGGREGDESPQDCVLRETWEEVGLRLEPKELVWSTTYMRPRGKVWFFAAHRPASAQKDIVLGDEGQGWALMDPRDYCSDALAVPHFATALQRYMTARHDRAVSAKNPPAVDSGGR